jgi:hypothetical protein
MGNHAMIQRAGAFGLQRQSGGGADIAVQHTVTLELADHSSVTRRTSVGPGQIVTLSVPLR